MSNLKLEVYDSTEEINKNQWNRLIAQSKLASFFHRYEWISSIETGIGLNARHIVVLKRGNPIGIFPHFVTRIEKTPFSGLISLTPGFGGPIIAGRERKTLDLMFKKIPEICSSTNTMCHIISVLDTGFARYGEYLESRGYSPRLGACRFTIDLSQNWADIKSNMRKARRREIERGHSARFEIVDKEINIGNLRDFYAVYQKVMKRVGGRAYPFSFFINLNERTKERIKIFSIIVGDQQVGEHLYLLDKEQSSMHHFFCVVEKSNFKHYPSQLLHDHAIKWAMEKGYKKYDFGATHANFDNSLFKFKEEFGGKVMPTLAWEKGYSKMRWRLFGLARRLYKRGG